ncbi:MAG: HigA family addiction module antitoxin [Pseudomonadota bacterium]
MHPGQILFEEFLEPMGISQQQLAEDISVSTQSISDIIQCKQAITADMALRLGRYFGMSAKLWLNLQGHYELDVAQETLSNRLALEVKPYVAPKIDWVMTSSPILNWENEDK